MYIFLNFDDYLYVKILSFTIISPLDDHDNLIEVHRQKYHKKKFIFDSHHTHLILLVDSFVVFFKFSKFFSMWASVDTKNQIFKSN